ncbi:MAG: extracellular solute-binding protein [Sumerlaeia bacterium]
MVIYTALDRQFSEPILEAFEEKTGIEVQALYDTEAVKTVGLVNRLIAERNRPSADIFWNNEIVRTLELKEQGLTQPFSVNSSSTIPSEFIDPEGHWVGFATRARVIMVNTNLVPNEEDQPTSVFDLIDPKWKGQAGYANPLFGTTSTHAAVLWSTLGEEGMVNYFESAKENAVLYSGNAQARDAVANGEIAWCLTDTDDAFGAIEDGKPVRIIYPDSKPGENGTVMIPNTLMKIANGPNSEAADQLLDYLLSEEVEQALANSRSAQIPVRSNLTPPNGIPSVEGVQLQEIDWKSVQSNLAESQSKLAELMQ